MSTPVLQNAGSLHRGDLSAMLEHALGDQKAIEVVDEAARQLGIRGATLSHDQAMSILEHIAEQRGLVGIAAGLAQSRLLFKSASNRLRPS